MKNKLTSLTIYCFVCLYALPIYAQSPDCQTVKSGVYEISGKNQLSSEIHFFRNENKVIHYFPHTQISELFERNASGGVKLTRYFNQHQRGIEYQPTDKLNNISDLDWSQKYQFIGDSFFSIANTNKTPTNSTNNTNKTPINNSTNKTPINNTRCDKQSSYSITRGNVRYSVVFDHSKQILQRFTVSNEQNELLESWQLKEESLDDAKSNAFISKVLNFQTTDYADIGDDHTDPFLTQMVNLGFIEKSSSGFYLMDKHQHLHSLEGNGHLH